jgi:hypothetical protein
MKVQQELMRHASIQTTMNVYGQAMSSSKREANSKGRGDGAQADESERLKPRFCEWESVGVNPEERPIKIKS